MPKLTPEEFAAKIKAQYPNYADIPDAELARKIVDKYPEYNDMVEFAAPVSTVPGFSRPGFDQLVHGVTKAAQAAFADQVPEAVYTESGRQLGEMNQAMTEYLSKPENQELYRKLHGDEALKTLLANQPSETAKVREAQVGFEQLAQEQRDQAAQKLGNVVQRVEDIKSVGDAASFFGQAIGQAAGQIPASVLTGGVSSSIMEASAVYNEQLDQLAAMHKISREEVIRQGLDKPAEGQVLAILATGLDMVSAGAVLNVFKEAGKKELKKSVMKNLLKGSIWEGITEGIQGNLERGGGTIGSGAEFNVDWSATLNESLAGAIGGGGLSAIEGGPSKEDFAKLNKDIDKIASTGDPALDVSIDDSAAETARFVDGVVEDVDKLGSKGSKLTTELDELTKKHAELENQLEDLNNLLTISRIGANDTKATTGSAALPTNPAQEGEATVSAVLNDEGKISFDDLEGALTEGPPAPKVDNFTTTPREINGKTVQDFDYNDEVGGTAQGSISGDIGLITDIYAAPANAENKDSFKRRGFYQKVINELVKRGVTKLRVSWQSEDSQAALARLVEKGVLSNPREFSGKNDTVPTLFDITQTTKENAVPERETTSVPVVTAPGNSTKVEQRVPKSEPSTKVQTETKKEKAAKPKLEPLPNNVQTVKAPKVKTEEDLQNEIKKAEEEKVRVAKKLEKEKARVEEKKQRTITRLEKKLENAAKRGVRPARQIATYDAVAKEAGELGLTDIAEKADKLYKDAADKRDDKTEVAEQNKEKATKRLSKEEYVAKRAEESEKKRQERENRSINKKMTIKKGTVFTEDSQDKVTRGDATKKYLTKAAQHFENYQKGDKESLKKYNTVVKEYIQFKQDNNLKPTTEEEIRKKITSGDYPTLARKENLKDQRARRNAKIAAKKLSVPAAKPLTAEQAIGTKKGDTVLWKNPRTGELQKETVKEVDATDASQPKIKIGHIWVEHNAFFTPPSKEEMAKYNEAKEEEQRLLREEKQAQLDEAKKAEIEAKKEIIKDAGLNPEDYDVEGSQNKKPSSASVESVRLIGHGLFSKFDKRNLKEVSVTDFLNDFGKAQSKVLKPFIDLLLKSLQKSVIARGGKLTIFVHNDKQAVNDGGFFITRKDGKGIVLFYNAAYGNVTNPTILHEIIHGKMSLLASALLSTSRNFETEVQGLFDKSKKLLVDNLVKIIKESEKHSVNVKGGGYTILYQNLSDEHIGVLRALDLYIANFQRYGSENRKDLQGGFDAMMELLANVGRLREERQTNMAVRHFNRLSLEQTISKWLSDNVYGFTNPAEMLAEAFSSIDFANLLNQIKTAETKKTPLTKKTVLTDLMDAFINAIKKTFEKTKDFVYAPKAYQTALDDVRAIIQHFDALYSNLDPSNIDYMDQFGIDYVSGISIAERFETGLDREAAKDSAQKDYDHYMELGWFHALRGAFKKVNNVRRKLNSTITKNIFNTLRKRKDIKTLEDVQDYINRVNAKLPANKQLSSAYAKALYKKLENNKKEIAQAKMTRTILMERAMDRKEYNESLHYRKSADAFASVDIDKLSPEKRALYLSGYEKLANRMTPTKAEFDVAITYGKTEPAKDIMVGLAPKLHAHYFKWLGSAANPSTFTTIISKFNTIVGDKVLKTMYSDLMEGFTKAMRQNSDLVKHVNRLATKANATHKDLAAVGIYGSIFSTRTDPADHAAWEQEVRENAKFAYEAALEKQIAFKYEKYQGELTEKEVDQEVEVAKALMDKFSTGPIKLDGHLTKGQQSIYDAIREFIIKHEADFERNAVAVWGQSDYEHRFNYFPTFVAGKTDGTTDADLVIAEKAKNLMDAAMAHDALDENTVAGKRSGSIDKRVNPKGYYYDFDALSITRKHSKNILLDIYTSMEFKKLNRLLKNPEFKKGMPKQIQNSFLRQIRHIAGSGNKYNEGPPGWLEKKYMAVRDALYTSAIATTGQFLSQSISGIANAAVITASLNPVKHTKNLSKALVAAGGVVAGEYKMNKFYKFLEDNGLGLQIRDIFFEKYLKPKDYRDKLGRTAAGLGQKFETITENPTRWGDKYAAAAVWFATYFDAGGTLENPNKDAILKAERMVGVLQNMSDINFSAPLFRSDNRMIRHAMMLFAPFKAFALNTELSLLYSARFSMQSPEARKVAAAQLSSLLAYRTAQVVVLSSLYGAIAKALADNPDGGDDDEKKRYSVWSDIFYNSMWDMLIGGWSPTLVDSFFRFLFNVAVAPTVFEPNNGEPFEQYLDSPIYSRTKGDKVFRDMMGPGVGDIYEGLVDGVDLMASDPGEEADWDKQQSHEQDKNFYAWNMLALFIATQTYLPLRGDAKRIINKYVNEGKSQKFKEQNAKPGAGEGEQEYSPFPEFEGVDNADEANYEPEPIEQ